MHEFDFKPRAQQRARNTSGTGTQQRPPRRGMPHVQILAAAALKKDLNLERICSCAKRARMVRQRARAVI